METAVIVLTKKTKKQKHKIEFENVFDSRTKKWEIAGRKPIDFDVITLVYMSENGKEDIMVAWMKSKDQAFLYKGSFNDGVV